MWQKMDDPVLVPTLLALLAVNLSGNVWLMARMDKVREENTTHRHALRTEVHVLVQNEIQDLREDMDRLERRITTGRGGDGC